jgi:hypothetical protein
MLDRCMSGWASNQPSGCILGRQTTLLVRIGVLEHRYRLVVLAQRPLGLEVSKAGFRWRE